MIKVNINDKNIDLSKYIELLESGEEKEIILSRGKESIAKLVLLTDRNQGVRVGAGEKLFGKKEFTLKDPKYGIEELFEKD